MTEQEYYLEIYGFWREGMKENVPPYSGVYFVYECTYMPENDSLAMKRLLYIGEAENVRERIGNHEEWDKWKKNVAEGNELCFSFTNALPKDRERIQAALIFQNKPLLNDTYKEGFPFDETTITARGCIDLLLTDYTVERTP